MRIVNKTNGRETTIGAAVSIVVDSNIDAVPLRDMVVRLLEELTTDALDKPVLRPMQLARILAYQFKVQD